ncbi:serine/threonine-protein kinase [Saccharothrix australiensis]|uniref:non-specific serine/threonine protein kinase n=1 Tax=Saccharothrix australiensis TaxID=2072 RepID=A0A495W2P1_9PSEU|nr:serine/threonine-protein kinase [Saccharothrix australiensis]RKT55739.1 protein kinase-like protein [Saccharothrix australiensis]
MNLLGHGPVADVYAVGGSALKVFPGRFDRRTLAAVERDRARLARLSAPVLPVERVEVVDGRHALRMELCGESLAKRVERAGPLSPEEVAALGGALSRALVAARRVDVLHGGVSPSNVLFRGTGEPVLADFGIAVRQAFRRDPLHGIEWVSPETLRTGVADARTDLYGLGAVLHFALTGESPHPSRIGEMTAERVLRVLGDPVPAISRPDVPVGLSTAIGRLLAPDPAKRSLQADEAPPAAGPPRRRVRRWWPAAAVAVALAVLVAFVAWPRAEERAAPPPSPAPPPSSATSAPPVEVVLDEPTDLVDAVSLTWTANDDKLFFAVVYWVEGGQGETLLAERNRAKKVSVEAGRKYCFLVRGTKGDRVVESRPKGVRGAVCRR